MHALKKYTHPTYFLINEKDYNSQPLSIGDIKMNQKNDQGWKTLTGIIFNEIDFRLSVIWN